MPRTGSAGRFSRVRGLEGTAALPAFGRLAINSVKLPRMAIRRELNVRLPNSPGALARVCRVLSDERVNILALSLDSTGGLRLVVDNAVRAAGVLRDQHHQVSERDVVVVSLANAPGGLAAALQLAANAGVNIDYAYASVVEGGTAATAVLGVADAQRAAAAAGL